MTWIKSQLFRPDGTPIEGCCVTATLVTRPGWLNDATGRVTARASTHSDATGLWRLDLMPTTRLEGEAFYRLVETCTDAVWYVQVPEATTPGEELWLRDVLVTPPEPQPAPVPFVRRLSDLSDVDRASVNNALPGDRLMLLPSGKWGAEHSAKLTMEWLPVPDDLASVTVTVLGFSASGVVINWGDGSPTETVTTSEPVPHTFAAPGAYEVTATDRRYPALSTRERVTIRDRLHRVHAFLDGDDDWRALIWLDEDDDDTVYTIDWGDGAKTVAKGHRRVPPRPRVPHDYTGLGRYNVAVTDTATKRPVTLPVDIGDIGILFTYDQPKRPRSWTRWLKTGSTYRIDSPGEAPFTGIVPASAQLTGTPNIDLPVGTHEFSVAEIVGGEQRRRSERDIVIPTPWDWRLQVEMTWTTSGDGTAQTVTVNPKGARTTCTVNWGDDSAEEDVEPGAPVAHTYTLPTPAEGRMLAIAEKPGNGVEDVRRFQRLLAEPRHVARPMLHARGRRAVIMEVAGADDPRNADWYRITWGDGNSGDGTSSIDTLGAVGRWFPASHVYGSDGTYTITIDAPGMAAPVQRTVEVVSYACPALTVSEYRDHQDAAIDPERRTARVSVDNTVSTGPCLVDLGDGTPVRECAETDYFTYQYREPGRYVLVATSKADRTAKDRATVTVPFGDVRTLFYEISQGATRWSVHFRLTGFAPGQDVIVEWGHQGQSSLVPPSNELEHDYPQFPSEKSYPLKVRYEDNSEFHTETVTVPFPEPTNRGG